MNYQKKTSSTGDKLFGFICVLSILIVGIYVYYRNKPSSKVEHFSTSVVFDIKSMIGRNIRELKKELGDGEMSYQATKLQIQRGDVTSTVTYFKDGYSLTIDYYDANGKIEDLYFAPESIEIYDYRQLVEQGNLSESDSKYSIKPMPVLGNRKEIASIKITPTP